MYTLTLTRADRQELDWFEQRSASGTELCRLLWEECTPDPLHADWDFDGDLTFTLTEHVAWRIADLFDEESVACLPGDLTTKLREFQASVV